MWKRFESDDQQFSKNLQWTKKNDFFKSLNLKKSLFLEKSQSRSNLISLNLQGFYRKDHLRKHTRSHIARRVKSEMTAQNANGIGNPQSGLAMHSNSWGQQYKDFW